MPPDTLAVLDGSTIWMCSRQRQDERRSTLTHELIHAERGECSTCTSRDEQYVRQETARRLITLDQLAEAMRWSTDAHEIAEHCWVDVDTVLTRLEHLHPAGRHHLRRATAHHRGERE